MNQKPTPRGKPRTSQRLKSIMRSAWKAWQSTKPPMPNYLSSSMDPRMTRSMNKRLSTNQLMMSPAQRKTRPLLDLR